MMKLRFKIIIWFFYGLFSNEVLSQEAKMVRYGLMIGNNDGGEEVVKLRYAHRDARKVRDVFQELGYLERKHSYIVLGGNKKQLKGK